MTEDDAQAMLSKLTEHYGKPVMPIDKYCAAIEIWMKQMQIKTRADATEQGVDLIKAGPLAHLSHVRRAIRKSNLLYRLLYLGEELRTEPCPVHKGSLRTHLMIFGTEPYMDNKGNMRERGLECGCDGTGWHPKNYQGVHRPSDELELSKACHRYLKAARQPGKGPQGDPEALAEIDAAWAALTGEEQIACGYVLMPFKPKKTSPEEPGQ